MTGVDVLAAFAAVGCVIAFMAFVGLFAGAIIGLGVLTLDRRR